jgi:C-terminal processing protease CtpA/Prc
MCDWLGFCVPQNSKAEIPLNDTRMPRSYHQVRAEPPPFERPPSAHVPMAGIGAAFESVDGGGLFVHSFAAGGPAQMCGLIHKGDQLTSVDGIDVRGMSAKELAQVLIGPVGSKVLVGFSRNVEHSSQQTQIHVDLVRQQSNVSRQGQGTPRADGKPA